MHFLVSQFLQFVSIGTFFLFFSPLSPVFLYSLSISQTHTLSLSLSLSLPLPLSFSLLEVLFNTASYMISAICYYQYDIPEATENPEDGIQKKAIKSKLKFL